MISLFLNDTLLEERVEHENTSRTIVIVIKKNVVIALIFEELSPRKEETSFERKLSLRADNARNILMSIKKRT